MFSWEKTVLRKSCVFAFKKVMAVCRGLLKMPCFLKVGSILSLSLQLPRVKSVGPLGEGLGAGDHGIYFAVLFACFGKNNTWSRIAVNGCFVHLAFKKKILGDIVEKLFSGL